MCKSRSVSRTVTDWGTYQAYPTYSIQNSTFSFILPVAGEIMTFSLLPYVAVKTFPAYSTASVKEVLTWNATKMIVGLDEAYN